jgi:hypothetical protein
MNLTRLALIPAIAAAFGLEAASGQTLTRVIAVFPGSSTVAYSEPAIIASPRNSNQAVVFCNKSSTLSGGLVRPAEYIPTINGFAQFTSPIPFPEPAVNTGQVSWNLLEDPGVAASPQTGDLYISASTQDTLVIARLPFGSTVLDPSVEAVRYEVGAGVPPIWGEQKDKPFIAAGRWAPLDAPHSGDTVYIPYLGHRYDGGGDFLRSCHSLDGSPTGSVWPVTEQSTGGPQVVDCSGTASQPQTARGNGSFPIVLPNGRVVLGYLGPPSSDPTSSLPVMTYSDGGGDIASNGRRWQLEQRLEQYGTPPSGPIFGPPQYLPSGILDEADLSMSADPRNSTDVDHNVVIAAFTGRADLSLPDDTDIFLARSISGGAPDIHTIPPRPAFPAVDTVRITNSMLRLGGVGNGVTAEYRPSVVLDWNGGINLLMCQTVLDTGELEPPQRVWYLRWTSFESVRSQSAPSFAACLTPNGFQPWPYFSRPQHAGAGNDYHMACLAGCDKLYLSYASAESGVWSVYVRAVLLGPCAVADVDGDGFVTLTDLALFLQSAASGNPIADRDFDGQVTIQDAIVYLLSYNP